jgi:hypothetical protein
LIADGIEELFMFWEILRYLNILTIHLYQSYSPFLQSILYYF